MEWLVNWFCQWDGPSATILIGLFLTYMEASKANQRLKRIEQKAAQDAGREEPKRRSGWLR